MPTKDEYSLLTMYRLSRIWPVDLRLATTPAAKAARLGAAPTKSAATARMLTPPWYQYLPLVSSRLYKDSASMDRPDLSQ